MVTLGKLRLFGLVLLFVSSMTSPAYGQCVPEQESNPSLFRFYLPTTCPQEEKLKHPIQSKDIVEAIRLGKVVDIQNAVIHGPFTLRSITVEAEVSIKGTTLTDPVDWSYTTFKKVLTLEENIFVKSADFTGTAIEKDLRLRKTIFETEAKFQLARIGGLAFFSGAVFKQRASFNGTQIEGGGLFRSEISEKKVYPVHFEGEADFRKARIGRRAEFNGAVFKQKASFNDAQIDGSAFFRSTISEKTVYPVHFEGEADFRGAQIGGHAEFDGAEFKQGAIFHSAQISESASFREARFERAANFGSARIGGPAVFDGAVFQKEVSFNGAQITGRAYFLQRTLKTGLTRPVHFWEGVNFKGTRIGGGADFSKTIFTKASSFKDADIKGSIIFKDAKFSGQLDFQGLIYSRIDVSWDTIKDRLYLPEPQVYAQLETAFRQSGNSAEADKIYFTSRDVESPKIKFWEAPLRYLNDRKAWLLVDYGRHPFNFLCFSIPIVIFGMVMFRREGAAEPKSREKCPLHPSCQCTTAMHRLPWRIAFWVSLNAFLPGVEVTAANAWDPSPLRDPLLKISYVEIATILRMIGWIVLVLGFSTLPEFLLR